MNNQKDEKRDEALIREFTESSKKLKTPDGLRNSNRRYIKDALHSLSAVKRKSPGWLKRRISIPYPVAAGFLIIFCLQLAFGFISLTSFFKTSEPIAIDDTDSNSQLEEFQQPYYSERSVYVAGIGYVETSKNYTYFTENDNESF